MHTLIKYLLFLLFIISTSSANYDVEEKEFIKNHPIINVGVEEYWPPFDFVENGKYTGLAKDYLDLIEKKTNLKFNYVIDSWENLLEKVKNKELDLLPILAKDKNREKFLLFTEKYLTIRDYIYTKSSRNDITSESNFEGKTIAIVEGYVQADYFKKNYPNTKIYLTKNIMETIDAVITNKADFLVSNTAIMNYLLNKHSISQIDAKFNFVSSGSNLHMATRNDYSILRNIIQKAINDISFSEKNAIQSKWLNVKVTNTNYFNKDELEYIQKTKKLIIGNELSYKPYDYNENNVAKGYIIDYTKLLFSKIGIEPIFKAKEWSSLINDFKEKEIDILPLITKNKDREEYISFTKPYLTQKMSIITKKSNTSLINIDDLDGKTVALAKNWNMTKFVKKYHPNIKVIEYTTVAEFLDAVANNYADATILDNLSANYYIKSKYQNKLHTTGTAIVKNFNPELFMGVHKDMKILKNILDKAMLLITTKEQEVLNNKWINFSNSIDFTKEELNFIKNNVVKTSLVKTWVPFAFEHNGKPYGLGYDFWNLIIDKANIKTLDTFNKDFTSSLESIKNKNSDILVTASKTKDREKFAIFSDEYFKAPIGIATLKDKDYIANAKELIGKRVAVGNNYTAHRLIKEAYPQIIFVPVKNINEALDLLSKDEVFAVVDIMPVLIHNIKTKGFSNIKITGVTGVDFNMRILIRKDYTILQSIINKVLKNITPQEKESIYNKWLNIEYEESIDYSLFWKIVFFFLVILFFMLYKNRQMKNYQIKLEQSQKEAEKSLKNFRTLIDLNIAGILIIRNKKIKYLNNEFIKILGYKSKSELINKEIAAIFDIKGIDKLCELLNEVTSYELNAIKADNSFIPILLKGKKAEFDNQDSHIISIIDLSEIKNKEKLLQEQSKLASLGEMIGNIAHQWRQPLSAISTSASGVKLQKEYGLLEDKNFNEAMDTITETSKFLSQTIDDFRNYIKDTKEKKYFNIKSSVERVLSIMKGSFTNNFIEVENSIQDSKINNYENEFTQVLLNILSNSKDALKNIEEKDRKIYIYSSQKDNNYILNVTDTGGGIPSHIIDKIFEPYFTTKHKSQGTGLGLYMTHKMIKESMGADIKIENCVYKNYRHCTSVKLVIPIN